MAGKNNKTRVTLPGSLADLVKDLQAGGAQGMRNAQDDATPKREQDDNKQKAQAPDNQLETTTDGAGEMSVAEAPEASNQQAAEAQEGTSVNEDVADARANRPIGGERPREEADNEGQRRGRPQKENTMKTYQIQKDDSADSWDLFLDLAKQYKTGGGRPATIYIDPTLKNILDRLKYPLSLTTSSILSSIVARFIYDHEDDVRKALFSQNIF